MYDEFGCDNGIWLDLKNCPAMVDLPMMIDHDGRTWVLDSLVC